MLAEPVAITIDPESELGRALVSAGRRASLVCLEVDGVRYNLELENPFAYADRYDPEAMRAFLREGTNVFQGVDVEALKRELREQR